MADAIAEKAELQSSDAAGQAMANKSECATRRAFGLGRSEPHISSRQYNLGRQRPRGPRKAMPCQFRRHRGAMPEADESIEATRQFDHWIRDAEQAGSHIEKLGAARCDAFGVGVAFQQRRPAIL